MHDTLPAEVQHQFNIDKQAFHELMKQVVQYQPNIESLDLSEK